MLRLKTTELAAWRTTRITANGGRCPLCQSGIKSPCADHDHATGVMRDTICRSCNSGLGQIERAVSRFGIPNLSAFLHGAAAYIQKHTTPQHQLLHPTFKTEEEKRVARNTAAKKRRLKAKD
jgi:Recombination endonuclease VII